MLQEALQIKRRRRRRKKSEHTQKPSTSLANNKDQPLDRGKTSTHASNFDGSDFMGKLCAYYIEPFFFSEGSVARASLSSPDLLTSSVIGWDDTWSPGVGGN